MAVPERIVSLVPSLTELVWWCGLGDRLVGRTRFCIEPAGAIEAVTAIGGTKDPDIARVVSLEPDLVIANKEENRREDVEAMEAAGLRVVVTDPNSVAEAVTMVRELGEMLGVEETAEGLARETEEAMRAGDDVSWRPRVFVAVWRTPLLGLGAASYGHDVVECAGAVNVLRERSRYPEVTREDLGAMRPDLILLPDEPYRFRESHVAEFADIAPARVIDGKLLWWYGPRMPAALRELRRLFGGSAGGTTAPPRR